MSGMSLIDPTAVITLKLIDIITSLNLNSGLKLCLDTADAASYTSGQKWLDRSGNGYDFMLGSETGSGSTGDEPTFNGNAGGQSASEFWSFDGGDFFRYDTTNETWMNDLHKNNALFTMLAIIKSTTAQTERAIFGTSGATVYSDYTKIGVGFMASGASASTPSLHVHRGLGTGPAKIASMSGTLPNDSAFHLLGVSLDEAGGGAGSWWVLDGEQQGASFNGSYSSPSSSDAGYTAEIAASGNAVRLNTSAKSLAAFAIWTGTKLSVGDMLSIYNSLIPRLS